MRPPPPVLLPPLLLLLQLGGRGVAAPPADSVSQLPAPQNVKIHLYNTKQVLSWDAVSLGNDTRPVVYQVQFKYPHSEWLNVDEDVNCSRITLTVCNFTPTSLVKGFLPHFNVSLRVRAELEDRVSDWVTVPWFQHYLNATIGPPENIQVTPGDSSLIISLSPPFEVNARKATFSYYVHYWEREEIKQVKGPFKRNTIVLTDLKPLRKYCLQVKAELSGTELNLSRLGRLSNKTCTETTVDASPKPEQIILIAVGTFLLLSVLAGGCLFLVLKYRSLIKYWFQSPPNIPLQIEEYLKDPAQPILEALDKDSSPKDDAWDCVSIISFPEKE